jgi:hypothetical protein
LQGIGKAGLPVDAYIGAKDMVALAIEKLAERRRPI